MRRFSLAIIVFVLLAPVVALAQEGEDRRVDVIDISGPLDEQAIEFIASSIGEAAERDSVAVVVQVDSPAVIGERASFENLRDLIAEPPLPVAVWVGPAPAVAYGGALDLLAVAQIGLAAPGVEIGLGLPTVVTEPDGSTGAAPSDLDSEVIEVSDDSPAVVDSVSPTIQQVVQELDGQTVTVGGEETVIATLEDGESLSVVYHKPGYWARFLRLAVTPEAALLFLLGGLTIAAFEFYAIGPGLAAGVAALSLFLGGYGMATLPLRWWAVALVLAGWWLLSASYQRGGVVALTALGSVLALVGGLAFIDGAPQLGMNPVVTVAIVGVVVLFYTVAMPTVARSRFSTRTIGRDHLIGSRGTALVDLDPDGEVEVAGARWKASSHREAGIAIGDSVVIVEVDGPILEVEPVPEN